MTEAIYLGDAGSEVELAYPDTMANSPRVVGRLVEMHNGSLHAHYQGTFGTWTISWTGITTAEKNEIKTEVDKQSDLTFVIGSTSYLVLVQMNSYSENKQPGTYPQLWDVGLTLVQKE